VNVAKFNSLRTSILGTPPAFTTAFADIMADNLWDNLAFEGDPTDQEIKDRQLEIVSNVTSNIATSITNE